MTCRLLYADALPVLYERSKFSFNSFDVLGDFCSKMARHQPLKAGALQCLRSVRLYFDLRDFKVPLQPANFTRLEACPGLVADRAIALDELIIETDTWLLRLAAHPSVAPVREVIRALGQFRALKTFRLDNTSEVAGRVGSYKLETPSPFLRSLSCLHHCRNTPSICSFAERSQAVHGRL